MSPQGTFIVPVNLTYYPLRAKINLLNRLAKRIVEDLPEKFVEELMTEGSMLLSGVDIDIRFGEPIEIAPYLNARAIMKDIQNPGVFDFDDRLPSLARLRKTSCKIMKRYMEAIYSLTTVNHDHIFASLIKHSLRNRMLEADLRRRAFLAIRQGPTAKNFSSTHLQESQLRLLLDDRHHKYADFLSVAVETRVVRRQAPYLWRNPRKFGTAFDFDRARIDNPLAVMANEVEPLTALQRKISRLCWMPGFQLRSRIVRYFRKKALQAFEHDYQRYFIAGESKPKSVGSPIWIRGRARKVGILLCHGYMAGPAEVKTLAGFLGGKGYYVYAPRLKGHGTAPEDLARCTYRIGSIQWRRAISSCVRPAGKWSSAGFQTERRWR